MYVCKQRDSFIEDFNLSNPRWEVILNNGETIFQDDGRQNG